MVYRALLVAAVLSLLVLSGLRTADAKQPSFIIAGGELGDYAAHVSSPFPEGPYLVFGAPTSQLELRRAPRSEPSLRYAIYDSGPYTAWNGPSHYYYPATRLLYTLANDRWYDVLPEWATFMDSAINKALTEKGRGELEVGPIAAGLRQSRIPEGTLWLRPNLGGEGSSYSSLSIGRCAGCAFLGSAEEFVMHDLAAILREGPTTGHSLRGPAYAIEFFASYGRGGVGGLVGFYAPPEDGESGSFWSPGYNYDTEEPYFETTPGFDAVIARALERNQEWGVMPSDGVLVAAQSGREVSTWLWISALAGSLAALLAAGGAIVYRRRTAQ